MSSAGSGAGCGVVLGIVLVLLAQQFGLLSLSALVPAIEFLIIAGVIGGLIGAGIGYALGRRYLANHPPASSGSPGTPPSS